MDKIVFTLWRSVGQGILSLKQKCAASIFLSFFILFQWLHLKSHTSMLYSRHKTVSDKMSTKEPG